MKHILLSLAVVLPIIASVHASAQQEAPGTKYWLKYYSGNLPEAKKMLHDCLGKGIDKIQGDEKIKCEAARDAWHLQPHKPSKK